MTAPGSDRLSGLLAERPWLLADGATGTALFAMGLESGDAPDLWNETEPRKVRALYARAVDAGSDLFLTNTFGANAARLRLHDAGARARDLNRIGAEIGRDVADAAGRSVVVAGSMGPTGEIMEPMGPLSHAGAVDIFHEQAEGLREGGADVLWLETLSSLDELRAGAEASAMADMPWCVTMSFDTAGKTMMGTTAPGMAETVAALGRPPVAFGANCGVGASDLVRTMLGFPAGAGPLIAKGNAGIPRFVEGHVHYDGTPALMADYAVLARDAGARVIGGCCGTGPEHLRAMRAALEERAKGDPPSLDRVAERLGAFSSEGDGIAAPPPRERRGRRRRP